MLRNVTLISALPPTRSCGSTRLEDTARERPLKTRPGGRGQVHQHFRRTLTNHPAYEKGIAILAPCTYRPLVSEQDAAGPSEDAAAGGQSPRRQIRGFRAVYVFDISQTEGEPLPEVGPVLLDGQAPTGLWDGLAAQITAHGYTVERGECSGANGYTDPATKIVRIRADVSDAQAVKTLAEKSSGTSSVGPCRTCRPIAPAAGGVRSRRSRWPTPW